ncbi:MAG: hypothetical protein PVSMB2_26960 [Ktedonobacteraceae bacterium]
MHMAKALDHAGTLEQPASLSRSLSSMQSLRLALGLTAAFGALIFFFGTTWDIQWHQYIGRDRTLIPPHQMMLVGVALSGIAGLVAVIIESIWARKSDAIAQRSTPFADIFHSSLGSYIVGFAALNAAVAFPLDSYWHALYGIDVAIWAPFHIMFAFGMGVVAFGAAYMLLSAANLPSRVESFRTKRIAYIGVIISFATMLSIFTLLLFDALKNNNALTLGRITISFFPLLAGLLIAFTFVAVKYTVPWRWTATAVATVYLLFAGVMALFVQPATEYLRGLEGLVYRRGNAPFTSIVTMEWFIAPIIVAILIDIFMYRAQKKQWSPRKLTLVLALTALIAGLPAPLFFPWLSFYFFYAYGIGFVIALLIGSLAACAGVWFGRNVGMSLQTLER